MPPKKSKAPARNPAAEALQKGLEILHECVMLRPLLRSTSCYLHKDNLCPPNAWAVVTNRGVIHLHPTRRGEPDEWAYVIAHCLLHLGFEHFRQKPDQHAWNAACDCFIAKFLSDLKLGRPPAGYRIEINTMTEERLYEQFHTAGIPAYAQDFGTAGRNSDMLFLPEPHKNSSEHGRRGEIDWAAAFARGLTYAVTHAVNVAGGLDTESETESRQTEAQRARAWFISSYPLLGALAATFKIIEDGLICQRMSITVAAVDAESREIYMNPGAHLSESECRFVMAHELLHVGLSHQARCQGRDPYLWNVACDYVINGWLIAMDVGTVPSFGLLYDPLLKDESAESVYDRMVGDLRTFRKLATLRGFGLGDMLDGKAAEWWKHGDGLTLDEFYRRCLAQGLTYHEAGHGFLPAGLIEDIQALSFPPVPWDVQLGRWFDAHFAPLEPFRSYARLSRRQSSTPDIPRPHWVTNPTAEDGRTFGVVLDTSGSMDRKLLAYALGAIASYSMAHDVPAVRVVFCDALPYDQGYMPPEVIAERVKVKGRGGTILQPAIDLLARAADFPRDAPLLIITDGRCDKLRIARDHAFLMPEGARLPFAPVGPIFGLRDNAT